MRSNLSLEPARGSTSTLKDRYQPLDAQEQQFAVRHGVRRRCELRLYES